MSTNIKPENRRLLEAVEYIDENIVLGVLSELRMPKEKHTDPVMTWRTPLKHWKSIAALAACVILLAFASPMASFISQVVSNFTSVAGGNAGAGTSELEMPTTAESEVIDSPYERSIYAYPEGMSAEEIYADVLKGGWVVNTDYEIVGGEKLWEDFLSKADNKTEASVLIASYYEESESIFLHSVSYDIEVYNCDRRYICQPENEDRISSFSAKYLVCHDMTSLTYAEKRNWDPPVKFVWFLTDYPEIPFIEQLITLDSDYNEFLIDNYPTWWSLIWLK